MENLKEWFDEAKVIKVFTFRSHEFVIRNGFKITHYLDDDSYTILNIRQSDFYCNVTQPDMDIFMEHGFIKGADIAVYKRNVVRVDKYLRLIEELYTKKAKYKKSLNKNKAFYTKRIRNCDKNIHEYHDMMQFYQSKVEQFENRKQLI